MSPAARLAAWRAPSSPHLPRSPSRPRVGNVRQQRSASARQAHAESHLAFAQACLLALAPAAAVGRAVRHRARAAAPRLRTISAGSAEKGRAPAQRSAKNATPVLSRCCAADEQRLKRRVAPAWAPRTRAAPAAGRTRPDGCGRAALLRPALLARRSVRRGAACAASSTPARGSIVSGGGAESSQRGSTADAARATRLEASRRILRLLRRRQGRHQRRRCGVYRPVQHAGRVARRKRHFARFSFVHTSSALNPSARGAPTAGRALRLTHATSRRRRSARRRCRVGGGRRRSGRRLLPC